MLDVLTPSKITRVYQDDKTKTWQDLSIFQADLNFVPDNCYIVGQVALTHQIDTLPVSSVFLVRPVMEGLVKPPEDYHLIWDDRKSGGSQDVSFWRVIPPAGYVALGDVAYGGYDKPSIAFTNKYACIRQDLVAVAKLSDQPFWTDKGSGAAMNGSIWQVENGDKPGDCGLVGFFKVQANYFKPPIEVHALLAKATKTE